jgi:hypothetical protein
MFPGDSLPIPVGSAALLSITHSLLHLASLPVIPLDGALFREEFHHHHRRRRRRKCLSCSHFCILCAVQSVTRNRPVVTIRFVAAAKTCGGNGMVLNPVITFVLNTISRLLR